MRVLILKDFNGLTDEKIDAAYELTTGVDLIHECVAKLVEKLRKFMEIELSVKQMDSIRVSASALNTIDARIGVIANSGCESELSLSMYY